MCICLCVFIRCVSECVTITSLQRCGIHHLPAPKAIREVRPGYEAFIPAVVVLDKHTHKHCEEPGGHPTLFWEVATGLGGVVGKKGAGDGVFHIKIYSYLFTFFGIHPKTCIYNKQTYIQNTQTPHSKVLRRTRHILEAQINYSLTH